MSYRIEAACASHIGKVRVSHEDNFFFDGVVLPQENHGQRLPLHADGERETVLMAVFDGMGGGDYGEAASFAAAIRLKELLKSPPQQGFMETDLEKMAQQLNLAVCEAQEELSSTRMGTTGALVYLSEGLVYACNVGDSKIFVLHGDEMIQLSKDHTDEAYMKARGIVGRRPRLTQYLGMNPNEVILEPYIRTERAESGDTFLICSDGLTDMLTPEQIRAVLLSGESARSCVRQLIDGALEQGGKDNVTVIVCRILDVVQSANEEETLK